MSKHELEYKDDILAAQDTHVITFKGKDPFRIRNKVEEMLRGILEINSSHFFMKYLAWDSTDGAFKAEWLAEMGEERWTRAWFTVRVWGWQNLTPDKEGWIKIKTWGELKTTYFYSNSIQKSLWWTYSYMFYDKHRRQLLEEARDKYFRIQDAIRDMYGINLKNPAIAPSP